MKKEKLIIFLRNPELGKVKTRLAQTVGDEKALAIFYRLLSHTRMITEDLPLDIDLYYSEFIDTEDQWSSKKYLKKLQSGGDLGQRMAHAFDAAFRDGYGKVCIIGTDCLEIGSHHILDAFAALGNKDLVIGPARDGGYYLLGMTHLIPELFDHKAWGTSTVLDATLDDAHNLALNVHLLETLNDIDVFDDLPDDWKPSSS